MAAGKEVVCSSSSSSYTLNADRERSEHPVLDFINYLEEARVKGLDHFLHEHRLEFKETMESDQEEESADDLARKRISARFRERWKETADDEEFAESEIKPVLEFKQMIICMVCQLEIEGSGFSCGVDKCHWRVHQLCAFLPREVKNYPNHDSEHTLILSHYPEGEAPQTIYQCSLCRKNLWAYFYRCNMCSFYLDIRCAAMQILVCSDHHPHPLTPMLYPAIFLCSLCCQKKEKMDVFYSCKTCAFLIHEECFSPRTTNLHTSHVHPLHITYYPPVPYRYYGYHSGCCVVCKSQERLDSIMMYSCSRCKHHIHLQCAKEKWEMKPIQLPEGTGELIEFPMPTVESVGDVLSRLIKQKCEWKAEDKIEPLLKHVCHDHPLVLNDSNNLTIMDRSCNACSLTISDASFYSCTQSTCNLILHTWCAKLPLEIHHPAHPKHTLLLHERHDKSFGVFNCNGCEQQGNGFLYKCMECYRHSFYLDIRCACLPTCLKHELHEHPLLPLPVKNIFHVSHLYYCNSCNGEEGLLFGCVACNFALDVGCLLLPQQVSHWYDREHGFKLTYEVPQCEQGYYCEFCEKELDRNYWIYHCFECDWSLDTECVRRSFNLFQGSMVLGESRYYPIHIHPLTCVLVPREWHSFCSSCRRNNYKENGGREFLCAECKIGFCTECIKRGSLSSYRRLFDRYSGDEIDGGTNLYPPETDIVPLATVTEIEEEAEIVPGIEEQTVRSLDADNARSSIVP